MFSVFLLPYTIVATIVITIVANPEIKVIVSNNAFKFKFSIAFLVLFVNNWTCLIIEISLNYFEGKPAQVGTIKPIVHPISSLCVLFILSYTSITTDATFSLYKAFV